MRNTQEDETAKQSPIAQVQDHKESHACGRSNRSVMSGCWIEPFGKQKYWRSNNATHLSNDGLIAASDDEARPQKSAYRQSQAEDENGFAEAHDVKQLSVPLHHIVVATCNRLEPKNTVPLEERIRTGNEGQSAGN